MPGLGEAPEAIQALAVWLEQRGTPLVVKRFDSPNFQVLEAETSRGTIELLVDRGGWFLTVAPPNSREFFDSAVWVACLTSTPVSAEIAPLSDQVSWLRGFVEESAPVEYSLACLQEARHKRAYRGMGLVD